MDCRFIIHISGPSGSGKTTLGNKLLNKYGNKIIVKDLDELRDEFINKNYKNFDYSMFDSNKYQKFIDNFIDKIFDKYNKPLIFTGINQMFLHNKKLYYNVHSKYNFFIDIDDMDIVKQKCIRFITSELQDWIKYNNKIKNDIINDNKKFVKLIKWNIEKECGTKETFKLNKIWRKDYMKQNYEFLNSNQIYKKILYYINKFLVK